MAGPARLGGRAAVLVASVNHSLTRRLLGAPFWARWPARTPAHRDWGEAMETLRNFVGTLGPVRLLVLGGVTLVGFFVWIIARASAPQQAQRPRHSRCRAGRPAAGGIRHSLSSGQWRNVGVRRRGSGRPDPRRPCRTGTARRRVSRLRDFDAGEPLGTTSFQQNLNLVRAVEGELARTIRPIDTVKAARVHLVLPRRELFSREKPEASASVLLMRGRMRLTVAQVTAVRHLIASAVSGLTPSRISIVDGQGTLLTETRTAPTRWARRAPTSAGASWRVTLPRTVEQLLKRIVGAGKVRAEVSATSTSIHQHQRGNLRPRRAGRSLDAVRRTKRHQHQ